VLFSNPALSRHGFGRVQRLTVSSLVAGFGFSVGSFHLFHLIFQQHCCTNRRTHSTICATVQFTRRYLGSIIRMKLVTLQQMQQHYHYTHSIAAVDPSKQCLYTSVEHAGLEQCRHQRHQLRSTLSIFHLL
jgi:hypothetical protein